MQKKFSHTQGKIIARRRILCDGKILDVVLRHAEENYQEFLDDLAEAEKVSPLNKGR